MSDVTVSAAPAVVTLGADASAPKPAAPASNAENNEKPAWLDARLDQARKQAIKDLGIEDPAEAKALIEAARAQKESAKTDAQKRGELETMLANERARIAEMAEALDVHAKSRMNVLTDEQRNAVTDIAGNDAAKQLKTIEALLPTWTKQAAIVEAKDPEAPRQTAGAPNMPSDKGATSSPEDPKAIWENLKSVNPIAAARYATANKLFSK